MSTLKNSTPSRPYRERAQPASRTRSHPLLEKHKDYALRAADHNAKKTRLKALRDKAASRNPDEFKFGMVGGAKAGGRGPRGVGNLGGVGDVEAGAVSEKVRREVGRGCGLSQGRVALLKGQDAGYLRVMRSKVRSEQERLSHALQVYEGERRGQGGELRVLGHERDRPREEEEDDDDDEILGVATTQQQRANNKHTIFVDSASTQRSFSPSTHFNTDDAGLQRVYNRPRLASTSTNTNGSIPTTGDTTAATTTKTPAAAAHKRRKQQDRQRAALASLDKQERELAKAERQLDLQRARMSGDSVGGVNKNGVKWKARGGRKR